MGPSSAWGVLSDCLWEITRRRPCDLGAKDERRATRDVRLRSQRRVQCKSIGHRPGWAIVWDRG